MCAVSVSGNDLSETPCRDEAASLHHDSDKHSLTATKHRGLVWDRRHGSWRSRIFFAGKQRHIGRFREAAVAARAYDRVAYYLYGEKAVLNFSLDEAAKDMGDIPLFIRQAKQQADAAAAASASDHLADSAEACSHVEGSALSSSKTDSSLQLPRPAPDGADLQPHQNRSVLVDSQQQELQQQMFLPDTCLARNHGAAPLAACAWAPHQPRHLHHSRLADCNGWMQHVGMPATAADTSMSTLQQPVSPTPVYATAGELLPSSLPLSLSGLYAPRCPPADNLLGNKTLSMGLATAGMLTDCSTRQYTSLAASRRVCDVHALAHGASHAQLQQHKQWSPSPSPLPLPGAGLSQSVLPGMAALQVRDVPGCLLPQHHSTIKPVPSGGMHNIAMLHSPLVCDPTEAGFSSASPLLPLQQQQQQQQHMVTHSIGAPSMYISSSDMLLPLNSLSQGMLQAHMMPAAVASSPLAFQQPGGVITNLNAISDLPSQVQPVISCSSHSDVAAAFHPLQGPNWSQQQQQQFRMLTLGASHRIVQQGSGAL